MRRHVFAKPFLKSLWSYPKQAGECSQAKMMFILKDTQELEQVIAVLRGMMACFLQHHQEYLLKSCANTKRRINSRIPENLQ